MLLFDVTKEVFRRCIEPAMAQCIYQTRRNVSGKYTGNNEFTEKISDAGEKVQAYLVSRIDDPFLVGVSGGKVSVE